MSEATLSVLGVALLGFDERARNVLKLFFEGPCAKSCTIADPEVAQVALIDLDAYDGRALKEEQERLRPGRPLILISLHDQAVGEALLLRKPVNGDALKQALGTVRTRLLAEAEARQRAADEEARLLAAEADRRLREASESVRAAGGMSAASQGTAEPGSDAQSQPDDEPEASARPHQRIVGDSSHSGTAAARMDDRVLAQFVGAAADLDARDPAQVAKAWYRVEHHLQGHLKAAWDQAQQTGRPVKVTGLWRSIVVDPVTATATCELTDAQLRPLCVMPTREGSVRIEVLPRGAAWAADFTHGRRVPIEAFLWQVALWTSRGRVPTDTNLHMQVILHHWPNLTRLVLIPHALRIAALWNKRPYSLARTAEVLNIPQRFVFAFYSAAWSLALVSLGRRQADQLLESEQPKEPANKGLLHRLLSRLRGRHA